MAGKSSSRKKQANSGLPKGGYRHPHGGIVMPATTKTYVDGNGKTQQVSIRAVHRDPPDLEQLAKAFIALAEEQNKDLGIEEIRAQDANASDDSSQSSDESRTALPDV